MIFPYIFFSFFSGWNPQKNANEMNRPRNWKLSSFFAMSPEQSQYIWRKTISQVGIGSIWSLNSLRLWINEICPLRFRVLPSIWMVLLLLITDGPTDKSPGPFFGPADSGPWTFLWHVGPWTFLWWNWKNIEFHWIWILPDFRRYQNNGNKGPDDGLNRFHSMNSAYLSLFNSCASLRAFIFAKMRFLTPPRCGRKILKPCTHQRNILCAFQSLRFAHLDPVLRTCLSMKFKESWSFIKQFQTPRSGAIRQVRRLGAKFG